ncbi:hypothetical protein BDV59DRAFT_205784 [Aspergillus ambiguus]|uniref:uncharacterized protein n=1 Tax=Aspergillus ambiguus TaxID=176160 RepID=UPI003CCDAE65
MVTDAELKRHGLAWNLHARVDVPRDEIVTALNSYTPVTSERNVWFFWDQGFEKMPPWIQRSVINCVRRHDTSWTFRLLNTVPDSPNHVLNYVDKSDFPAGATDGRFSHAEAAQHISDFTRVAVVYRYGGIYLDPGMILFRDLDKICWDALEDPKSHYEVATMITTALNPFAILNFFVAARKNDPFIYRWKQVFLQVWQNRTHSVGLHAHPLLRHLPLTCVNVDGIPVDADWTSFNDYIALTKSFERVRLNREPGADGFDGPEYFRNRFFNLDYCEIYRTQMQYGEEKIHQLLTLPRENCPYGNPVDDVKNQDEASRVIHDLLANSAGTKYSNAGNAHANMTSFSIAEHWGRPEHAEDDCQPGTWGEYLRYGSVHFRQTRAIVPISIPEEIPRITEVGLYEYVLD